MKKVVGQDNDEYMYPCDKCGTDTDNIDDNLDIICDKCK